MSNTKSSLKDAISRTTPGITTESSRPHFTQLQQKTRIITSESSDYSAVIIVVVAVVIFVLVVIIAIFVTLMQRRKHREKLLLAAELEKEEKERRRRRARRKRTPRKSRGKSTPKLRKFAKPRSKEEMMMELSDFLEAHSKKYRTPEEPTVGSAEPSPVPTPTVTPGLLSSEVDISFKSPAAADTHLQKLSPEDAEYPQKFKQPSTPEADEKEGADRTPSIEISEKSEKKSTGTPTVPAAPSSSNITPASNTKSVTTESRQATPTAIEHEDLNESRSREQESWDLESAEKEGYPDKSMEQWEEKLQKAEKPEKEEEGSRNHKKK
ncbi:unnamed protein product [Cylicocyclus nassatus]|uniref:Uncharacterized protein n=1 Tax=Cylicocyclus nassatus TaxID=53992 RepID=A0AA36M487_CYLNA|nr:unnamed protein product [Cylicocyclus nassatus]